MRKKTDEEKLKEYTDFFDMFCKELSIRNDGYRFSYKIDKRKDMWSGKMLGYDAKMYVYNDKINYSPIIVTKIYENELYQKPKKTELNAMRSLFRNIFSDKKLVIAQYNEENTKPNEDLEDFDDNVRIKHFVTARFEKYRNPIEASMKLTLQGFNMLKE